MISNPSPAMSAILRRAESPVDSFVRAESSTAVPVSLVDVMLVPFVGGGVDRMAKVCDDAIGELWRPASFM